MRDLANIDGLTDMPRLLALLASRVGQLINYADLARSLAIPQTTLKRYMALLEMTFLVRPLPAWFANIGKRLTKAPKLMLADTGLATHLIAADAQRLRRDRKLLGHVSENFVAMELTKQLGWSERRCQLFHFRTDAGAEVDLVLEDRMGRLVGIEVKSASPAEAGFPGLGSAGGVDWATVCPRPSSVHGRNLGALWEEALCAAHLATVGLNP